MAIYYQEDILTKDIPRADLEKLIRPPSGPAVSIFLDTQKFSISSRRDQIKLKNLISQAENRLLAMGYRSIEAGKILEPVKELQRNILFWQKQGESLAIYSSYDFFQYYKLPFKIKEMAIAGHRFHIKPLMPLLCCHWRFNLLTLSQKKTELFRGSPYHLESIPEVKLPQGLDEKSKESRKNLNFRNLKGNRVFYGHGEATEDLKGKIQQYFQEINRVVSGFLTENKTPLILAGVDYFLPIYRKVNSYPCLLKDSIKGNPDKIKSTKLHQAAWQIAESHFQKEKDDDWALYQKLNGTGKTSQDLAEIVLAAKEGRINTLFVAKDKECWGEIDDSSGSVSISSDGPGLNDIDLLDYVVSQTFQHNQKIYLLDSTEMPKGVLASVIFHY